MNLFTAAGIDVDTEAGAKRSGRLNVPRSLRVPLLNYRVVAEARKRAAFAPTPEQAEVAAKYAKMARNNKFLRQKETAVRNIFIAEVLQKLLGYRPFDPEASYTLAVEKQIRHGAVDVALGRFPGPSGKDEIVSPFELKGPTTLDLDAVMPGRGRSPVQQAWEYAMDAPGSRWILVSNCLEIRLYRFGRGRDAYESIDLTRLDDEEEHARLWLLLDAKRLLEGATDALLRESESAYRTITDDLYAQYKGLRERLVQFLIDSADGPRLSGLKAIEQAQKILDRILFVAFAQRTDLLQDGLLQRAAKARNEFAPEPLWRNFQGLFRYLDKGNFDLDIWAYNGGLFAPDPASDAIVLPDELASDLAHLAEWDYRSDVPVTVLGHIFEQSITDLETMRAESQGLQPPEISKRKKQGVYYTPDFVTRFLVERTIGKTLAERFETLRLLHAEAEAKPGGEIAWRDEAGFWRAYLAELRSLTVLDPACGSGAFLVAAFDVLAAEYRRVVERLSALGETVDFDPFDEIVTKNLFGVDLNAESVEITRLSLWLKTARRKHRLQSLEETIRIGDSVIADPAFTSRPFDWDREFQGRRFDIVIGNPPYVRMEFLKSVKPYLERHYKVAADRADLYAYFFERGVRLLKPGGRLGYISSSTFFRTGSGEALRALLAEGSLIEAVVDFGDLQVFEDVTTYPAILTLRRPREGEAAEGDLAFLKIAGTLPDEIGPLFEEKAVTMPRARLGSGSWQFEDDALARLRRKIVSGRRTLGEVYGPPMRGIVTGLNEAFVIDRTTRDRLVQKDPKSAELLKPFLRGEDVKRWRVEPQDLFLINTPKGKVDIDDYPAIRDWLLPFKPELEKRATKQEWFELQQAQLAYQERLTKPKIVYPEISQGAKFALDERGFFLLNKLFFIDGDYPLLGFLNSKLCWFFLFGTASPLRGGKWRLELREQYMAEIPITSWSGSVKESLASSSKNAAICSEEKLRIASATARRILDLAPPGKPAKLSRRLENWWELDFPAFLAEAKRVFQGEIPLKKRGEWEEYLAENRAEVLRLTAAIEAAEREIDAIVYRLFDLTAEEIALLETSLEGQY